MRRDTTNVLTEAVIDYYTHKKYGVFKELGICSWGKLRVDVCALSLKGQFVGVEVKSCKDDFKTDNKIAKYLPYFDKFYLCCPESMTNWVKPLLNSISPYIGLFSLGDDGFLYCVKSAKTLPSPSLESRYKFLLRLSWRCSTFNKHNRPKRTRRFIK